eukprot:scaffold6395_cov54-Phaeocystis_antarctica.AAC.1
MASPGQDWSREGCRWRRRGCIGGLLATWRRRGISMLAIESKFYSPLQIAVRAKPTAGCSAKTVPKQCQN